MPTRRSLLQAGIGSLAAATIGGRLTAYALPALQKVKVVLPQGTVFILSYYGGKDAGIYEKHGIDLEIDARPFAGSIAGLPSKQCMAVSYPGLNAIDKINEGLDWVIIGPGSTISQDILVRNDSPYKTIADLRGKKFGTFSTGASAFKVIRAILIEAFHLDLLKDFHLEQIRGPALNKLLERGQVDAVINLSSRTMAAESQPDKFRVLFSPDAYWRQKTGYPIGWAAPIVAWRSWVNENKARAKNFSAATVDSFKWLEKPANLDTVVKTHGELAGVTNAAEIGEYKLWLDKKQLLLPSWDEKAVDAQWQFLELAKKTGVITKVPPKDKYALFVGELGA